MQNIEDINLLQLMKDIKNLISREEIEVKTDNYEIKIDKNIKFTNLEVLNKVLDFMVKDSCLITELYFENKIDFEKYFGFSYDEEANRALNSFRIEEIKFEGKETYSGTFIFAEEYGNKLIIDLATAKYLAKFQRERIWHIQ